MSCPPARALIHCPLHPRSKVQASWTPQSTDELIPQTSLALDLTQSKSPAAARITGTRTPSQEILPKAEGERAASLLQLDFQLWAFLSPPPFLPPLYFVSLFSFRLNVKSRCGEECSQPAIPHNSPASPNFHFVLAPRAAASPSPGAGREERWELR